MVAAVFAGGKSKGLSPWSARRMLASPSTG